MELKNKTILLVDDEPGIRRSFERMFKAAGWNVLTAEGVRAAEKLIGSADVVLSDYRMPDGTGDDVVKLAVGKPVVILTAEPERTKHEHVLCKPCESTVMLETIDSVLKMHELQSRR